MRSLSLNERGIFYLTAPGLYFEACLALSPCLTSSLVQYAFAESVVTSRFGAFAQLECWNLKIASDLSLLLIVWQILLYQELLMFFLINVPLQANCDSTFC